ncbi:RRP12-like protein [Chelonia mydas]|uniref:RRP12-like protein n=1 Tax=Chelonia mydas TaxID=8469 RepID=M7B6X0_CHEMY|nr:RRP12-like protein [Chelonia mydas]
MSERSAAVPILAGASGCDCTAAEKSDLTVDALKLHNELQSGSVRSELPGQGAQLRMEEDDGPAVSEKSSRTFLSGLSDCTNFTFSKVQRFWESNSAAHREICAVLAAVTEVIRSQGGTESETEYFAALICAVLAAVTEVIRSQGGTESETEYFAALDSWMGCVRPGAAGVSVQGPGVPGPVLIKKFSDTSKVLMSIMASQASSGPSSALRWVLSCLATLLRKQDLAAWSYPVTLQVYHGLLSFTVHAKPKVRKEAQHGVCSILKGSEFLFGDTAPTHHPAAQSTARFCVQEIEKSGGTKEATTTLHVLTLLRDLLPCLPLAAVKTCCETLLRVMTLSHVALLSECVAPHMAELGPVSASASGPASHVCRMFRAVEEGLTYRFHAAWASVLQVLRAFFETCGKQCHPFMRKCLQSLCDLRHSPHFPHTSELDRAVGAAVASMGPEVLLQAVALEIDGTEETLDFPRSWLLPVIRDHVQGTRLSFFTSYFLPLAATLKSRAAELAQAGKSLESKIYDTLQCQIWTMLPGFCTRPTDLAASFKGLAQGLGMAISERADLRLTVCQALRTLISKGCETDAERAEVGRFAKNFLPILFNVYSQPGDAGEGAAHRRSLLDTVRTYLTITEQQVILCTKEVSVGARKNAFMLLVEMGQAFLRFGPTPQAPFADSLRPSVEELLADSDSEEEEGERRGGREQRKQARQKSQAWLKEGEGDEPLNFLDPNVAQRVLATKPGSGRPRGASHDFKVSADGRLVIREGPEDDEGAKGVDEEMADLMQEVGIRSKGRGDVKKKGRLDPYAYIPLNRAKLNRRKKAKMQGQFKGLMKGAQRGAQTGRKHRQKERRV